MKIKGVQTIDIDIEISKEEMNRIAIEALCKLYKWNSEWYITDGQIYDDTVLYTTHSWINKTFVRDATAHDEFVFNTIKQLKIK